MDARAANGRESKRTEAFETREEQPVLSVSDGESGYTIVASDELLKAIKDAIISGIRKLSALVKRVAALTAALIMLLWALARFVFRYWPYLKPILTDLLTK